MKTIHQLPQIVISKIAAGEVIERPAYAVKELIDNAIDAKADYITITIEEAGLKKIVISDNGIGMNKEDILESYKPHTTSKIASEDELIGIPSLGFRGEALASISAISYLTIQSKVSAAKEGLELRIKNGSVEKITPVGIPLGTTISIEQLFQNVPVRKKFLKSQSTEFRHITEIIAQHALAFPNIRFFLTHNKKIILDLPKTQSIENRIKTLLGTDLFSQMIPISASENYIKINGYLAKPQSVTKTSSKQFIFVNNRRIYDKFIASVIKEAYGNLLESSSQPIFILFLTVPFEMVDVNIHPKKDQVNFLNRKVILEYIYNHVKETLEEKNITFKTIRWKEDPLFNDKTKKLFSAKTGYTNSFAGKLLKDSVIPWDSRSDGIQRDAPVEQLHNLYIITQTKNGMLMIDQHAAHERILYEQLSEAFQKKTQLFAKFILPTPKPIELSITDAALVEEYIETLGKIGIALEHFQANTYIVSSVPEFLKDRNMKIYILELLDTLSEEKNVEQIDSNTKRMLAYLACRSAIKAGDRLTKKQMFDIIKKLEETKNNATCPHGRPTKVTVSLPEIHRLFKR